MSKPFSFSMRNAQIFGPEWPPAIAGLYDDGETRNGAAYSVAAVSDATNALLLPNKSILTRWRVGRGDHRMELGKQRRESGHTSVMETVEEDSETVPMVKKTKRGSKK
eukprot:COSAG01_NODE_2841_length_6991_cov_4.702554_1_plen_108_part_00